MECFMPYFALIIMFYYVKIACYQKSYRISECIERENQNQI